MRRRPPTAARDVPGATSTANSGKAGRRPPKHGVIFPVVPPPLAGDTSHAMIEQARNMMTKCHVTLWSSLIPYRRTLSASSDKQHFSGAKGVLTELIRSTTLLMYNC